MLLHKSHIPFTFITTALIKVLLYYVLFILFEVAVISFSHMNLGSQVFSFTTKKIAKKIKQWLSMVYFIIATPKGNSLEHCYHYRLSDTKRIWKEMR